MIKPTVQLLEEAKEDLSEIIDYVAAETADVSLLLWLQDLELKFGTIYRRLSHPVVQQETKKHVPEDPYKKTSDFAEVKACVDAGKLPPLGSVKTGTQYINSKCYVEDGKLHWI
jgi:hypothetical protein